MENGDGVFQRPPSLRRWSMRLLIHRFSPSGSACRPASLGPSHLEHDGLERQTRRSAKFANERFAQSVDDMIRIDLAAGANQVDQWITVDERTRKGADTRDFRVPGQHGSPQIDEAGRSQTP